MPTNTPTTPPPAAAEAVRAEMQEYLRTLERDMVEQRDVRVYIECTHVMVKGWEQFTTQQAARIAELEGVADVCAKFTARAINAHCESSWWSDDGHQNELAISGLIESVTVTAENICYGAHHCTCEVGEECYHVTAAGKRVQEYAKQSTPPGGAARE